jgi:signal transduction histidine kinase
MLTRDAMVTMQFIQNIAQINNPSNYFAPQRTRRNHTTMDDRSTPEEVKASKAALEEFFAHILVMPEVVRANVYNDDKQIIWSSHPYLVGKRFQDNPELSKALAGQLAVKTATVKRKRKSEHVDFPLGVSRFVENYIPIWNTAGNKVVGVVEVYRVPHALFRSIDKGNRLIWGSAVAGGLFLYGSLFWIVRRAAQVIHRQQALLVESETMAALGEMTSAIAHNLRNPLASIRSSAELLTEEETSSFIRETAMDIVAAVDRLDQRIRELFAYARPPQHTLRPVQLNALIQETLQQLQPDLNHKGIKLELDLADALPPLQGDASLLQQACWSFITNAVEAMPHGGTLAITSRPATNLRDIQLSISDTGQGIPKDHVKQAFRPFFTTKPKGLGVGLAFAKRIVERHEGTLEIASEEGRGTTVSIYFPATE